VINAIYIAMNNKRENFKGENAFKLILTILINPAFVIISYIVDLVSLPSLLLKDERGFEFKYQQALEILNATQIDVILTTFAKIFYVNFKQIYGGKGMTLIELMQMHTRGYHFHHIVRIHIQHPAPLIPCCYVHQQIQVCIQKP
jgi:hypothetical protein